MTSSDVIIRTQRTLPEVLAEINGQLVSINKRLDEQQSQLNRIQQQLGILENNQILLGERMNILNSKVDFAMWFIGICFAAMAILVVVAPSIRRFWQEVFPPMPDIDKLIDEKIAQALSRHRG